MTILSAIQNACSQLIIDSPDAVFSSSDVDIITLRNLANVEATSLLRLHDWQVLRKENTFTTSASETQTGAIPDDFLRFVNGTMNNRSLNRPVWGPLTPQEWQREKALPIYTSPNFAFIQRGGDLLFSPTPSATNTIYFEYISKNIVSDSGGTGKQYFTADDDTLNIDEKLLDLGLVWRFRASKGLDYSQEKAIYDEILSSAVSQEKPSATISMDGRSPRYRLGMPVVKEGSWP